MLMSLRFYRTLHGLVRFLNFHYVPIVGDGKSALIHFLCDTGPPVRV